VLSSSGATGANHQGIKTDAYDLQPPDLNEAHEAINRLYGANATQMWNTLLSNAGLTGAETDSAALDRLLAAMFATDPVTALCARSIQLRAETHGRLSTVHALIRAAEQSHTAPKS
jgi:hypothetical protein